MSKNKKGKAFISKRGKKHDRRRPFADAVNTGMLSGMHYSPFKDLFEGMDFSKGFYIKLSAEGLEIGEAGSEGDPLHTNNCYDEAGGAGTAPIGSS